MVSLSCVPAESRSVNHRVNLHSKCKGLKQGLQHLRHQEIGCNTDCRFVIETCTIVRILTEVKSACASVGLQLTFY